MIEILYETQRATIEAKINELVGNGYKRSGDLIITKSLRSNDRYEHGPSYTVGFYQVMELDESKPLVESVAELELEVKDLMKKYNELIMSVERKHEGESRHETALRYIREAERSGDCAGEAEEGDK